MEEDISEGMSMTESKSSNKIGYIVIGIVCLLLIFSAVQAFQINEIKSNLKPGKTIDASLTGQAVRQPAAQSQPAPTMVGGC